MKFGDIHEINSILQQIQNEEKTKVVESCGCGCGTKEECTCGPECSSCDCHSVNEDFQDDRKYQSLEELYSKLVDIEKHIKRLGVMDSAEEWEGKPVTGTGDIHDQLITMSKSVQGLQGAVARALKVVPGEQNPDVQKFNKKAVGEVAQKNYNDYKGIQLHNLKKQLNQVSKTLLALTDIEDKDNSSDMVNDLRNMHGALSDLKDAHNNAFEKLNTGRHRKESTNEVAEHGSTEYYRELDKGQLNHTKSMLMKTAGQLNVAIEQRYKFSKEIMGTGDRVGTGDLQKMLDTLKSMIANWDEETKIYGK